MTSLDRGSPPWGRRLGVGVALGLGLIAAGVHRAAADPLPVRSGKVVLPITGLAVDLPKDARKQATWMLSGSWSLTNGGASFDGRDVIDLKVGDKLVAGNWVHIGYFDAGDCAKVVQALDVPDRWTAQQKLWGQDFQIAGGTWDFENDLGKKPAIALCTPGPAGSSLLLYHFFLEAKPPATSKAALAAIAKDKLLPRVTKAWATGASGPATPTTLPQIKQRGDIAAARTVALAQTQLEVALPSDGFVWLARSGDDGSDFLDRMAPSLPDVTLEIGRAPGTTCAAIMPQMIASQQTFAEPPPTGVPFGWTAYPTLQLDKARERLVCKDVGGAALVVGLMATPPTTPAARDFGPLAAVLEALALATAKTP
ncbi:MAG: hypothetical protein KA201_03730 [Kofleriaceae bacterium]|nr:hypothetical protein [Kofleriaceae bacterium]